MPRTGPPVPRYTLKQPFDKFHGLVYDPESESGQVLYSSRTGANVSRVHFLPVQPLTTPQLAAINGFGVPSQAWSALDPETDAAWNNAARGMTGTDILGHVYPLTGQALYYSCNWYRRAAEQYYTIAPPPVVEVLPVSGILLVQSNPANNRVRIRLDCSGIPDGSWIYVQTTDPWPSRNRQPRPEDFHCPDDSVRRAMCQVSGGVVNQLFIRSQVGLAAGHLCGIRARTVSHGFLPGPVVTLFPHTVTPP